MSGELQVVFIYDTQRCRREEDDPREAILYFHPAEIPEVRRLAICGQLMGITQFLLEMFSAPKILSLANGKFALKDFGKQYILALGCSSVTPDWLLEKQADILYQITKFFHKDIDNILSAVGQDREALGQKLSSIMDHYIPISQHHGDLFALTFGILPILNLPKSASHISLSATVVLQTCMLNKGVLGGIVMFQNKVIAVELMQELSHKLAFIQPYQLPPADSAPLGNFSIPPGVQLLKVYVKRTELEELRKTASNFQSPSKTNGIGGSNSISNTPPNLSKNIRKNKNKINSILEESTPSESLTEHSSNSKSVISSSSSESNISSKSSKNYDKSDNKPIPQRLLKSLENLSVHHNQNENEDDPAAIVKPSLKTFSTSITDPLFPFLRSDGKNISQYYLDEFAYPNPDKDKPEDDEGEKSFKQIPQKIEIIQKEKENEPPLEKKPILKTNKTPRPKDLALNFNSSSSSSSSLSSRSKAKRRWSTFEDMMSPVYENPPALEPEMLDNVRTQKSASFAEPGIIHKFQVSSEPFQMSSLLSSFRKLSSPEVDALSDSGRGSSLDNKLRSDIQSPDREKSQNQSQNLPWPLGFDKSICSEPAEEYEDIVLFIYSLGGMRLLLLLDKGSSKDTELIQTLREYGSSSISELEAAVAGVEEQSMSLGHGAHDHYCYLHYEPVWRSLRSGGRTNHSMDFEVVQHMHQDFRCHPKINELIIRGDDHVVYGYQCVGSEVFYQQSAGPQPGLPMPSDLMGKVPLKAKRRLERDHNILLL